MNTDEPSKPKGWFANLRKGPKICLIVVIVLLVLLAIFLPLTYFVFIPNTIQSMINQVGANKLTLESFQIKQFSSDSMKIGIHLIIPPMVPFGIKIGLGQMNVKVLDLDSRLIATTAVDPIEFYPNSDIDIALNTTVQFGQENSENISKLLEKLAVGVDNMKVTIELNTPIKVAGIQLYSSLPLKRTIEMGEFRTEIGTAVKALNRVADSLSPKSFEKTGDKLAAQFDKNDIFRFADSLSVVWSQWDFDGVDQGITTRLRLEVENGTPFSMVPMDNISCFVEIEGIVIGHVQVKQVQFLEGLGVMEFDATVQFDHPLVPKDNLKNAIEIGSQNFAKNGDLVISIIGPVTIPSASFIEKATSKLKFQLPLVTLLRLGSNTISSIFSNVGLELENIWSNSTLGAEFTSNDIKFPVQISLPNLAPIPKSFKFPFSSSVSVVGPTASLLDFVVEPILFARNSERVQFNSSVSIVPQKTEAAAVELATAVNPMLGLTKQESFLELSKLVIGSSPTTPYAWCEKLLGTSRIKIYLPHVNKTALIEMIAENDLSNLGNLQSLDVVQQGTVAGFDLTIAGQLQESIPKLKVDLGYIGMDVSIEDLQFSKFDLVNGVKLSPDSKEVKVNPRATLGSGDLGSRVKRLMDALNGNGSSNIGIGGFSFGPAANNVFNTFSKINVQLPASDISLIWKKVSVDSLFPSLKDYRSVIQSVDMNIEQKDIVLQTKMSLDNASKYSVQVGPVSLSVLFGGSPLGIETNGIRMARGSNQMDMNIRLKLAQVGGSTPDYVAKVISSVQNSESVAGVLSLSELVLGSPSTNPVARVNQFESFVIDVATDRVVKALSEGDSVDMTAVLPNSDFFQKLGVKVTSADVTALQSASLQIGSSLEYTNTLPLSVNIPFLSMGVTLDGESIGAFDITGTRLVREKGSMAVGVIFKTSTSEKAAQFVRELVDNPSSVSIAIRDLIIGDQNNRIDLLSKTSLVIDKWIPKSLSLSSIGVSLDDIQIDVQKVDVALQAGSKIQTNLVTQLKSPVKVSLAIPTIQLSAQIDNVMFGDVTTSVSFTDSATMNANALVTVKESEQLKDKMKQVVENFIGTSTINGPFGLKDLLLGVSQTDRVTLFKDISLSFELPQALQTQIKNATNINPEAVISNMSLESIGIKTVGNRKLNLNAQANLKTPAVFNIQGLKYIQLVSGLDNIDVLSIQSNDFEIGSKVRVGSEITFPSSVQIQDKVSAFAKSLLTNGPGNSEEMITARSIRFGLDESSSFKFLEKVVVSINSKSLITPALVEEIKKLLNNNQELKLGKVLIDGYRNAPNLALDADVAFKASVQAMVDDIVFETSLNEQRYLLLIRFVYGTSKLATVNGNVQLANNVNIDPSGNLQMILKDLFDAYMNGSPLPGKASIQGITFGGIDTFSKIKVDETMDKLFKLASTSTIKVPAITDIIPNGVELDVYGIRSLIANFGADIQNLDLDVQVRLPFFKIETMLNSGRFMDIQVNNLEVANKKVTGSSVVWFPNEPENMNILVGRVADLLFHRATPSNDVITIKEFSFGSPAAPINAFKRMSTAVNIAEYYKAAAKYFDEKQPIELDDIQAVCVQKGIAVDIKTTNPPFPVKVNLQYLEIDIGWQLEGKGTVYRAMQVKMDQINLPSFRVFATVNTDEASGALKPLRELVIQMLTFKPFTSNGRLGYLVLVGSNGERFVPFDQTLFVTPGLFIPIPMYVKLDPYQLPLIAIAAVRNPTPVHVDLGSAFLKVNGMDGALALDATTRGDVVAPNNKEGGNPPPPTLPLPFTTLDVNVESLPTAFNGNRERFDSLTDDMINNPAAFDVVVEIKRNGVIIDWVDTVTKYLLASGLADELMPLIGELLKNIEIEILPPPDELARRGPVTLSGTNSTMKELNFSKNIVLVQ